MISIGQTNARCMNVACPDKSVQNLVVNPARIMRLYLINPSNPQVSILNTGDRRWNRYRVWKPLGLMVIAGLTPSDWEITIIDENLGVPDYSVMPKPDFVGITALTSQAHRAYELATLFRQGGSPVALGGIHATMCREEASRYADTIVTGEAKSVWGTVLEDVRNNRLKPWYEGGLADMSQMPQAQHVILKGARYRQRPIEQVINELRHIPEDLILIVDDNPVGTRQEHLKRAKKQF